MRIVADVVRGKNAQKSIDTLEFMPQKAAAMVRRAIQDAYGNLVDQNRDERVDDERLIVKTIMVRRGPGHQAVPARLARSGPPDPQAVEPLDRHRRHARREDAQQAVHRARRARRGLTHTQTTNPMGQKTNPVGFRLGVIRGWDSNWYTDGSYAENLVEDLRDP